MCHEFMLEEKELQQTMNVMTKKLNQTGYLKI